MSTCSLSLRKVSMCTCVDTVGTVDGTVGPCGVSHDGKWMRVSPEELLVTFWWLDGAVLDLISFHDDVAQLLGCLFHLGGQEEARRRHLRACGSHALVASAAGQRPREACMLG